MSTREFLEELVAVSLIFAVFFAFARVLTDLLPGGGVPVKLLVFLALLMIFGLLD